MCAHSNRLSIVVATIGCFVSLPAFAFTFSWTPDNTDIVVNADSLQLTGDGITVTAQAFTAEINVAGDDAVVVGPWPTQSSPNTPGFGVDIRGSGSEQLGLFADPDADNSANGTDYFPNANISPGFSTSYGYDPTAYGNTGYGYNPALWNLVVPTPSAFHFALFSFDQPVNLPGVTVDDVTNQDRDIWMATSTTAPDFSAGFLSGIASFDIVNSPDDPASDGLFTHNLPSEAEGISYFLVGAPPKGADLGPISGTGDFSGSNFFIVSFDGTPSDVDPGPGPGPDPSPVPEPTTLGLLVSGLLGLGVLRRKRVV